MAEGTKAAPRVVRASRASVTTIGSLAVGLITAALIAGVPAWHHGLPLFVQYLIPVLVSAAGAFVTAYNSKHPTVLPEVEAIVEKYAAVLGKIQAAKTGMMSIDVKSNLDPAAAAAWVKAKYGGPAALPREQSPATETTEGMGGTIDQEQESKPALPPGPPTTR